MQYQATGKFIYPHQSQFQEGDSTSDEGIIYMPHGTSKCIKSTIPLLSVVDLPRLF